MKTSLEGEACVILLILCLQAAVSKKKLPERLTLSQEQFFVSFAIPCYYCQLVRNTAVITKPDSPLPISHIPEVISHLQLGYLLWPITDLPRTEEDLSVFETLRDSVWDITSLSPGGWFYISLFHYNIPCQQNLKSLPVIFNTVLKRGEVYRRQIWYEEGHGNTRTGWPVPQENKGAVSPHVPTWWRRDEANNPNSSVLSKTYTRLI